MYSPQVLIITLLAACATLVGSLSIEPRQLGDLACNVARVQIVKALADTNKAVGQIADPTVQAAAAAGVQQAQGGIGQVAKGLISGSSNNTAGRDEVSAGLTATNAALTGGDTADQAVVDAQTSLQAAVTAGQDVVSKCK